MSHDSIYYTTTPDARHEIVIKIFMKLCTWSSPEWAPALAGLEARRRSCVYEVSFRVQHPDWSFYPMFLHQGKNIGRRVWGTKSPKKESQKYLCGAFINFYRSAFVATLEKSGRAFIASRKWAYYITKPLFSIVFKIKWVSSLTLLFPLYL